MMQLKNISILIVFLILIGFKLEGQNISINESGADPDNSAMLDVSANDKGILIPRMTAAQRLAIPSPANGLMVFQTDVPRGFYAYVAANTVWTRLAFDSTLNLERVLLGGNDAANNPIINLSRIGIGTNSPVSEVHVIRNQGASNNDGAFIDIQNSSGSFGSLTGVRFKVNTSTTNIRYQAAIFHRLLSGGGGGYQLNFAVRNNSVADVVDTADIIMTINDLGRVGINTVVPSTELDVNGDVSADNYLYKTPQTRYYTIGETEYRMARLDGEISSTFGVGGAGIINSTGFNALVTPVHLPDGARVTAVEAYYVDNSATGNLTIAFDRRTLNGSFNNLFSGTTSGAIATIQTLNLTGASVTINNASYSYGVRVYSADWSSTATKDMSIMTVRITYIVTETD